MKPTRKEAVKWLRDYISINGVPLVDCNVVRFWSRNELVQWSFMGLMKIIFSKNNKKYNEK